jgi:hypothetical protein
VTNEINETDGQILCDPLYESTSSLLSLVNEYIKEDSSEIVKSENNSEKLE